MGCRIELGCQISSSEDRSGDFERTLDWVADLVVVRTAREILKGIGLGCRFSSSEDRSGDIKRHWIRLPI